MASTFVNSLIYRFARVFSFSFGIVLLLSLLHPAAQAQTGHTWNGVTGAEDTSYDGSASSSGYSDLGEDAISGDGRFVTFSSSKTNLFPGKENSYTDAVVRDRLTRQIELISIGMDGSFANGYSSRPSISANGRHVVFFSNATNLVSGDTNDDWDLYVRDRQLGTTTLVSIGPSGEPARGLNNAYSSYHISADGRFIAFVATFNPSSSNAFVWLRDRDTDGNGIFDEPGGTAIAQISPTSIGSFTSWNTFNVAISGNGRFIAYNSQNTQDGTNGRLFVFDRETGLTKRIDVPASGLSDASGQSLDADMDYEGKYLVYTSTAPNIVQGDGDSYRDLFLCDMETGGNTRLRLSHAGAPTLQQWYSPSISGDGRYIAVKGSETPYGLSHAFVLAPQTGTSREISFIDNGTPDANPYYGISGMSISADGSAIAFADSGDTWGYWQPARTVFVAIDLSLSTNSVEIPQQGGSFTFNVSAPENTAWTVRTLWPDRIVVMNPASGVGPGQAIVNVLPNNSGIDGNIFVYVGSEKVQISQPSLSTILSVTPSSGPMQGGTVVQIIGRGFVQGASVTFGGIPATDVTVLDSSTIQATTPPVARAHSVEVDVFNPDGSTGRIVNGFRYEDPTPPVVTAKLSGTPGNNDWFISDVEVAWEINDPESEIEYTDGCETSIVSGDSFLTLICTARSFGGTTTQSVDVKIDTMPPQIYIDVPRQGRSYTHDAQVITNYACIDSSNGSGTVECIGPVVSGTNLNTSEPGTYTFTVTARDAAGNQSTAEARYAIIKRIPIVYWSNPSAITYGMPLSSIQLNASANVPGTFTYNPPAGTILSTGTRTLSVTFVPNDIAGNETVTRSVQLIVQKATPTIIWGTPASIVYGTPLNATQLNASCSVSGTFTYTPPAGTILPAGASTLTATFAPIDVVNYLTTSRAVSITVQKATPVITWTPGSLTDGTPLGTAQLNASANIPGAFTYTPPAGTILTAGTRTLTASFVPDDTVNYANADRSISITVKMRPTVTWAAPASIAYGTPLSAAQLNAIANVPGSFKYSPAWGTILPVGAHTLNVTFESWDNNYGTADARVTIIVKTVPVISWNTPANIVYGTPLGIDQLNATATVAGAFSYTPASGTILNAGTHTLTVNFVPDDTDNYVSASQSISLTIVKAAPEITWGTPESVKYPASLGSRQLNATANIAGTFTYTPATGTNLAAGTHTLTVNFVPNNPGNYTNASMSVSFTVNKGTPLVFWNAPANIVYGTPLGVDQLNAHTSILEGTFTYTPDRGTILPAGSHTLSVNYVPWDSANYENTSLSVSITVLKASSVISWSNPLAISHGTPLGASQLNATANTTGTFSYTPAAGTILPTGTQTLNVTFTPDDLSNCETANASTTIFVMKLYPVISWTNPQDIIYRTPLGTDQLNATSNVPGTISYTPAAGTILPAGTQALYVLFEPDDKSIYETVGTHVFITVKKATPIISWSNPANIVYGTPLSTTQLNATVNVSGTLSYAYGLGTVLTPGNYGISVLFTPNDLSNYNYAHANASLTVVPATLTVRADNMTKLYGQELPVFTAAITGFVAGDGIASLSGTLSFTTPATATSAPGTYSVTPRGVNSQNYYVNFVAGNLTITKASTSTTLSTTPNPSSNRQMVQITATVAPVLPGAGMPSGSVQFLDNGVALGTVSLVNGVATIRISFQKGTHPLIAVYAGDGNFTGSSGSRTQQVR
jgi:hypothetical protein